MFGRMKLKLCAIALFAIAATFCMQGTFAFYSTTGVATNVVTTGGIEMAIRETTDGGNPFPKEGVYIMPGDIVSKRVTVESLCSHPFYLRVKPVYGIDSEALSSEDCFKLNVNDENWQLHEGWYYYTTAVLPGETTPEVFSHVEIVGDKVDTGYIGHTLTLTVVAQAVQSEHNPLTDGKVWTASGWPAETEAKEG